MRWLIWIIGLSFIWLYTEIEFFVKSVQERKV